MDTIKFLGNVVLSLKARVHQTLLFGSIFCQPSEDRHLSRLFSPLQDQLPALLPLSLLGNFLSFGGLEELSYGAAVLDDVLEFLLHKGF